MVTLIKFLILVTQVFAVSESTPDWENCKSNSECVLPRLNFNCRVDNFRSNVDFRTVISYTAYTERECRGLASRPQRLSTDDYVGVCFQKKCQARLISPVSVNKKALPTEISKLCAGGNFADYGGAWLAGVFNTVPDLPRNALQLACKYPDGSYFISCLSYYTELRVDSIWAIKGENGYKEENFEGPPQKVLTICPPHPKISKPMMIKRVVSNKT